MSTKQAFQAYAQRHESEAVATCALGAAFYAVGVSLDAEPMDSRAAHEWGFWKADCYRCPQCGVAPFLAGAIEHLNDVHRWTREEIADWLESLGH